MQHDVYMHAINSVRYYDALHTKKLLCKILKSNALLSLRNQGKPSTGGFAGRDFVSLCDYNKKDLSHPDRKGYNSYNHFIKNGISLIVSTEGLEVIEPTIVDICTNDMKGYKRMEKLGNSTTERYSDMPDEVQVMDIVPLDNLLGLTIPCHLFSENDHKNFDRIINSIIEELDKILIKYNRDIPIYDITTELNLKDKEQKETALRLLKK